MFYSDSLKTEDVDLLEAEIESLHKNTPRTARTAIAAMVKQSRTKLADRFYAVMADYPGAAFFLADGIIGQKIHQSLANWITELFHADPPPAHLVAQHQMEVGSLHARIKVPVPMIMRAYRELKTALHEDLRFARLSAPEGVAAANYLSSMLDVSQAIMTAAYVRHSERGARADEALRLFSISQDPTAERERQRAAVAEWAQDVFFAAQNTRGHTDGHPGGHTDGLDDMPSLERSEFGLWFTHRADLLFGRVPEYQALGQHIAQASRLLETLRRTRQDDERVATLRALKLEVVNIRTLLNFLFNTLNTEDFGRDPLTRLLNRRFLASTVSREIATHKQNQTKFCIAIFTINDAEALHRRLSENAWDEFIKKCAQYFLENTRSADSLFRNGDASFLLLRIETSLAETRNDVKDMAAHFRQMHFSLDRQGLDNISFSYSVYEHDGHPDPKHVVRMAEKAEKFTE